MKLLLAYVKEDPTIITKWIKMYFRYYQNWLHESYDYVKKKVIKVTASKRVRKKERKFLSTLRFIDLIMKSMLRIRRVLKIIIIPLSNSLNTLMRKSLPIIEPINSAIIKLLNPISNKLSNKMIKFVDKANPSIFYVY